MFQVGKPPTIKYPLGSVIEDQNARMKLLKRQEKSDGDLYQVEIIHWNKQPPQEVLKLIDLTNFWILVNDRSTEKIRLIQ